MDLSPVVIAIPIYFSLISLELIIQYFTGREVYRWNDAITNISCGIVQQLSGLFLRIFSIGIYHVIYTYSASFMLNEIKKIKKPVDKLKYIFYKPGWLPDEMGGYQSPQEVDRNSYKKFTTPSLPLLNYYILFQFILTIGFTAYVLFNQQIYSITEIVAGVLLIIFTVGNLGALFEWRSWAPPTEGLRIITISVVGTVYVYLNNWALIPILTSILFMLISLYWLNKSSIQIRHEFEQ